MDTKVKVIIFGLMLIGVLFAQPKGATGLTELLSSLCVTAQQLMITAMFLMVLLAAVTYAAGQIMGAETRARATVWATAMFTGALFAGIIFAITPWAISIIANTPISCEATAVTS